MTTTDFGSFPAPTVPTSTAPAAPAANQSRLSTEIPLTTIAPHSPIAPAPNGHGPIVMTKP